MKNMVKACAALFLSIAAAAMVVPSFTGSAGAQDCNIDLVKDAPGGGDVEFIFTTQVEGQDPVERTLSDGDSVNILFSTSLPVLITELPTEGWELIDIECDGEGLTFKISRDEPIAGIFCDEAGGTGSCTFVNQSGKPIPTLSEWGMIAAAAGLALIGVFFAVRRKRAALNS